MGVRKFILFQLILLCVLFSSYIPATLKLPITPEVPTAFAATICPKFRDRNPATSDVATNQNTIREEDKIKKACSGTGVFAKVRCALLKLFANFSSPENRPGKLDLKDSQMPGYLRTANELALSGDLEERDEPGGITGGIAKMLPPGYEHGWDSLDPIKELKESEGQLVTGKIILNNSNLQKNFTDTVYEEGNLEAVEADKPGYYNLQIETDKGPASNYQVEGKFGEIAPLYDRYGLLKQALMPSAESVEITKDDCIDYDPSVIVVTGFEGANPNRNVPWTAYQYVGDEDEEVVDCEVEEVGGILVEDCPEDLGDEGFEVGGNLDVQTKVSLASEAWGRIGAPSNNPGGGGVFNVLLPPDTSFRTEQAEPQLRFDYDTHSDLDDYSDSSKLYIADLGNVEGAVSCIVDQLTAHPANAQYGACKAAFDLFAAGMPVECTDEATPLDFANTASSSIAQRAWEIVDNLYQGFWCRWNWSKKDYPQLFDEDWYRREPDVPWWDIQNCGSCLFWCTHLLYKSGVPNLGGSYNSDVIAQHFGAKGDSPYYESSGRFIAKKDATWKNIKPGYVVFFQSPRINRLNHVGIVYEVTESYIKIVHANSVWKSEGITIGKEGVQDIPWAVVSGFGKP